MAPRLTVALKQLGSTTSRRAGFLRQILPARPGEWARLAPTAFALAPGGPAGPELAKQFHPLAGYRQGQPSMARRPLTLLVRPRPGDKRRQNPALLEQADQPQPSRNSASSWPGPRLDSPAPAYSLLPLHGGRTQHRDQSQGPAPLQRILQTSTFLPAAGVGMESHLGDHPCNRPLSKQLKSRSASATTGAGLGAG